MRPPTCTSIGFGTRVPRPYFGAELGSSNSFADLFNARSPLHRATSGCNGYARSASKIRQMQASRGAELTYGRVTAAFMVNFVSGQQVPQPSLRPISSYPRRLLLKTSPI